MRPIERIRREVFEVTQAAFGAIAGASQGTVSKWERGELEPDRDQLARIRAEAKRLQLPWDDALFFDDAPSVAERAA